MRVRRGDPVMEKATRSGGEKSSKLELVASPLLISAERRSTAVPCSRSTPPVSPTDNKVEQLASRSRRVGRQPPMEDSSGPLLSQRGEAEGRSKGRGWKTVPFIIGNEAFERVATQGLTANFLIYLMSQYHMKQVAAVNLGNIFSGTTNIAPLAGAYFSDAYWGRFRTLAGASLATFLGMVMLTLTAAIPQLRPKPCSPAEGVTAVAAATQCPGPSGYQMSFLLLSLIILILGSGGVRPCGLPFGVDQFDRSTAQGRQDLASFFNWYFSISNAAMAVAMTVVVYVQDSVSWTIGFGLSTVLMLLAIVIFFAGIRSYVHVRPEGSVFSGIAQTLVAAFRKRKLPLPVPNDAVKQAAMLYNRKEAQLPLTLQFRYLNKAGIICPGDINEEDGRPSNPWRLCTVQQIEELKCLIRILPIWASGILCFVAISQQWTFATLQALKMNRHIGPHFQIPAASLGVISLFAITVFIPIYDRLIVPAARRLTGIESGITLLQRQGVGMVISVASMVVAGLVETKRRESAIAHGGMSPMSALWLAPQLIIMGVAEAFNAVGQVEFYNGQFPEHLQTMAAALFNLSLAGAGYINTMLISVVRAATAGGGVSWLDDDINLGRVDYFYYLIAGLGMGNLVYFMICAHYYHYKGSPDKGIEAE